MDRVTLKRWLFDVLGPSRDGMHVNDMAASILQKHTDLSVAQDQLKIELNRLLVADVKSKAPQFRKIRKRKGRYALKIDRAPRAQTMARPEVVDAHYLAKAGEYFVMSELLYWGLNVSPMVVDKGIDVVAERNNKIFRIQVKTSAAQTRSGAFSFSIRRASFESNQGVETFYVFVIRTQTEWVPLVFSYLELQRRVIAGQIVGDGTLSLRINYDATRRKYFLQDRNDVTSFARNFGQLT